MQITFTIWNQILAFHLYIIILYIFPLLLQKKQHSWAYETKLHPFRTNWLIHAYTTNNFHSDYIISSILYIDLCLADFIGTSSHFKMDVFQSNDLIAL